MAVSSSPAKEQPVASIALVGHSNVGKTALFHQLTGVYAPVSNYPGTTVEVARGDARELISTAVIDTPGVVTLPPVSEDEQVTARILLEEPLEAIVQVGDAKSLRRTLLLTVLLAEMGLPLVLALNMVDEADRRGIQVDTVALGRSLGIDVVPTVAIRGEGIEELVRALDQRSSAQFSIRYPRIIESSLAALCQHLPQEGPSCRGVALLWLAGDPVVDAWLRERVAEETLLTLEHIRAEAQIHFATPLSEAIQSRRLEFVDRLLPSYVHHNGKTASGLAEWLGRVSTHPIFGLPVLALVLLGLYFFVGVFGAGTLVDLLEVRVLGGWINPLVSSVVENLIPWPLAVDFLVGEFGLWTMGMTYALALILPIVTTFFLAFGLLEDTGYLPRLSVLTNRTFRRMGLNGRAVLPMILGLGCVTMATMTTRVLETRRERLLVILLLALGVPCSAQLGVVMGLLAGVGLTATLLWGAVVLGVLLAVGALAARLLPGKSNPLLLELPPLRRPVLANVLTKTLARLEWYMKEVIPIFLVGTAVMFVLDITGGLAWLIQVGKPLVTGWLGLPPAASAALIMGFLRRDFGATGLFVLEAAGQLSPSQVVVSMVTVTLFIPCLASVLMVARERNWRTAAGVVAFVFPLAFFVGGLLHRLLFWLGWGL